MRVPNKALLERLEKIEKGSKKQMDMAVVALAAAYILLGVSMQSYSSFAKEIIGTGSIILGLIVIYIILKPYKNKKK